MRRRRPEVRRARPRPRRHASARSRRDRKPVGHSRRKEQTSSAGITRLNPAAIAARVPVVLRAFVEDEAAGNRRVARRGSAEGAVPRQALPRRALGTAQELAVEPDDHGCPRLLDGFDHTVERLEVPALKIADSVAAVARPSHHGWNGFERHGKGRLLEHAAMEFEPSSSPGATPAPDPGGRSDPERPWGAPGSPGLLCYARNDGSDSSSFCPALACAYSLMPSKDCSFLRSNR